MEPGKGSAMSVLVPGHKCETVEPHGPRARSPAFCSGSAGSLCADIDFVDKGDSTHLLLLLTPQVFPGPDRCAGWLLVLNITAGSPFFRLCHSAHLLKTRISLCFQYVPDKNLISLDWMIVWGGGWCD